MLLARQACGQNLWATMPSRSMMEPCPELVADVNGEEMLLRDGAVSRLPSSTQLAQNGQQQSIGHGFDGMHSKSRGIHLLQLVFIKPRNRTDDAIAIAGPRPFLHCNPAGLRRSQCGTNLADRETLPEQPENVLNLIDLFAPIQPMAARGAQWLDQAIPALPRPQRHGVHARDVRHRADRKELCGCGVARS